MKILDILHNSLELFRKIAEFQILQFKERISKEKKAIIPYENDVEKWLKDQ